jgi:hypothetical protein
VEDIDWTRLREVSVVEIEWRPGFIHRSLKSVWNKKLILLW